MYGNIPQIIQIIITARFDTFDTFAKNQIRQLSLSSKCMVGWTKKWQEFSNLKVHFGSISFVFVGGCDFTKGHDTIHIPNLGSIAPHLLANYWYDHLEDLPPSCACNLTHTSLKIRMKPKNFINHFFFLFFSFIIFV